jgi:hypothetical protein
MAVILSDNNLLLFGVRIRKEPIACQEVLLNRVK